MDLDQVEVFLTLAEELHFGRTAALLHLSQPRVSRLVAALERQVGGQLFERSSRQVRLTSLGEKLRADWAPAYAGLRQGLRDAQATARVESAPLQLGFTLTTGGYRLNRLVRAFEQRHPLWPVVLRELPLENPFEPLRRREVDVLAQWVMPEPPGLEYGGVFGEEPRVLAVASDSPLARQSSVSSEVLGDELVVNFAPVDEHIRALIVPTHTPAGRPVRSHPTPSTTVAEALSMIARGAAVHPTVASMAQLTYGQNIALIPIEDMPPIQLGLYWTRGSTDARVRALAEVAASLSRGLPGRRVVGGEPGEVTRARGDPPSGPAIG